MSQTEVRKLPTLEQAIAKAEALVRSKASTKGEVISLSTYSSMYGIIGQTDIYSIEGNVEIETSPEIRVPAQKDFLGREKIAEKVTPRKFQSAIYKIQLKLEDLSTLGFELRF